MQLEQQALLLMFTIRLLVVNAVANPNMGRGLRASSLYSLML